MEGLLNENDVANGQRLRVSGWSKYTLLSVHSKVACEPSFALFMFNFCKLHTTLGSFLLLFSSLR